MAVEAIKFYSAPEAPYLGVISEEMRTLFVYFLINHGAERLVESLPYPRRFPDRHPEIDLNSLSCTVRDYPKCLGFLDDSEYEQWDSWRIHAFSALAESFLDFKGETDHRPFVTNDQIYSLVRQRAEAGLTPVCVSQTLKCGEANTYLVLPDVMIFKANPEGVFSLSDFYDLNRMIPGGYHYKTTGRVSGIATTLANPDTQLVLKDSLQFALGLDQINIPPAANIRFRVVTAQKSSIPTVTNPELITSQRDLNLYFDHDLAIGVNVSDFAYFILQGLNGGLPQVPPEKLFQRVG